MMRLTVPIALWYVAVGLAGDELRRRSAPTYALLGVSYVLWRAVKEKP